MPTSYADAVATSKATGKPLLLLITAAGCVPCSRLKKRISEMQGRGLLQDVIFYIVNRDTVLGEEVKVSKEEEPEMHTAVPQLVLYRRRGEVLVKTYIIGLRPEQEILNFVAK